MSEAASRPPATVPDSTDGEAPRDIWTLRAIIETQNVINNAGLSLDEVMAVVIEQARSLTNARGAVVEMAVGDEMVYAAVTGTASNSLGLRLNIETSLSGMSVRTGKILRCDDSETDPRVDRDACRRVGARSMVVAPLTHQGVTAGALKVISDLPRAFDDRHVGILQILAGFIAASLSHINSFEEKQSHLVELDRLNGALDKFSSHVAHDLRGPLAQIRMATELLVEEPAGPQAPHLVEIISRQAGRGVDLVAELLTLAKASRSPQLELVDVADLVGEVAEGIDGLVVDDLCVGVQVSADRVSVRQAFTNLLSNAARYGRSDDGLAHISVGCDAGPTGWKVTVADRGSGLPTEHKGRLLDAFDRGGLLDSEGTGLGLAIVAATAAAHGGEAGCEETPGGGATFWFTGATPA